MPAGRPKKPKTEKIKCLEGTPKIPDFIAEKPLYADAWNQAVADLTDLGLISRSDVAMIAIYAQALGELKKLTREIDEKGVVFFTDKGNAFQNPAVGARNRAVERLAAAARQLGLSPAARLKVNTTTKSTEADALSDFLGVKK